MSTRASHDQTAVAAADLAARLDVGIDEIAVVSVDEVTWRDSSLGCPKPGMMYAQALVPGHRILLSSGGRTYTYHSGGARSPFLCDEPQLP